MKIRLTADSSSNIQTMSGLDYTAAPLTIVAGEREYVDTPSLDVEKMMQGLKEHKGKSSTACPGVGDWLNAFGEKQGIKFTITISADAETACDGIKQYF